MKHAHRKAAATLAVALVVLSGVPAGAAERPLARMSANDCDLVSLPTEVPQELVRPFIPERFQLAESMLPGHTHLTLNTASCTSGLAWSSLIVTIVSPEDPGRADPYLLWMIANQESLVTRLDRAGIETALVEDVSLEANAGDPLGDLVTLRVGWEGSAFNARGLVPSATAALYDVDPSSATWWHLNEGRLLKISVLGSFDEPTGANEIDGQLDIDPGSDLALMFGGPVQAMSGFFVTDYEFRLSATPVST